MSTFYTDIKYGLRQLIQTPGFTTIAIVSLALGIGVCTAVFSLLNAVWMQSLPVENPHQLRLVNWSGHNVSYSNFTGGAADGGRQRDGANVCSSFPYPLYRDFKEQVEGCSDVFAFFGLEGLTVVCPQGAITTAAMMVSGDFFNGYGANALIGRTLQPEDEVTGATPVAMITHRLWDRQYDLDPAVLGQMITINEHSFTIVGVLPRSYSGPQIGDMAQIYVPMSAQPQFVKRHPLDGRDQWWVNIMARLEAGADEAQVQATMEGLLLQNLSAPQQQTRADNAHILLIDGSRGQLGMRKMMAQGLAVIMIAVILVLCIACANLAGLLLARGATRQPELTIRAAMGAKRGRLIRQLLTESLLLSLAGAGLGLLLSVWIKATILGFIPDSLDSFRLDVRTDLRVLSFTLAMAVLTCLFFGLLPALRVTRIDLNNTLKGQRILGHLTLRMGKVLVAAQVSLTVLLLVGTGVLTQSLIRLYRTELGFETDQILVFGLNPGQAGYHDANAVQYFDQISDQLTALPGVRRVAFSSEGLLSGNLSCSGFSLPGRTVPEDQHLQADLLTVNEAFFATLQIPLLQGRPFARTDTASQPWVTIINQKLAETCFGHEDPLNQTIRMGNRDYRIIGVCQNAKYNRVQRNIEPALYFSHRQSQTEGMVVEVQCKSDPLRLLPAVRRVVADVDRGIPMKNITTQAQLFKNSITPERIFANLCSGLAFMGTVLSCIGIYALMAFMVTRRTNEFGVRLALGAQPRDIARPVIVHALHLAGFGLLIGIPISLGFTHILRSVLFGVSPHDPATLALAIGLVLIVAILSAWIPARRAAKIDPMEALRYE